MACISQPMEGSLVETGGIMVGEFRKIEMVCKEAVGHGRKLKHV